MANPNKPFGFAPIRSRGGSSYEAGLTRYNIVSGNGSAFYIGDVVLSDAHGDTVGVPAVAKSTANQTNRGIFVGVELAAVNIASLQGTLLDNTVTSIPATKTKAYYVYVQDDPEVMCVIQGDATGTNQVEANCNKNFNLTVTAGATAQSVSASVIDSSTMNATTQGHSFKLHGLHQVPGNAYGAYAVWVAYLNQHELMGNTAGV